jgi:hydroxymethylpyrimidine/phosphomethylpyrimidine kinase
MKKPSTQSTPVKIALTIAGSDSGGGAGIQADLKTFTAMGVFGTSAITCITAQNPDAVTGIEAISTKLITAQIKAVITGFPVAATKTGMLFSKDVIHAVAKSIQSLPCGSVIVDPVMISTSGTRLLKQDAIKSLFQELLPLATVITPNLNEAEILAGFKIKSLNDLQKAALLISKRFGTACLAKGGHLEGNNVVDVLCVDQEITRYTSPRVRLRGTTHGTGCTFSAALTAALANGEDLHEAVAIAKQFVTESLKSAHPAGKHYPLNFFIRG